MTPQNRNTLTLIAPRFLPPLDPLFRPAALTNRHFREQVKSTGEPLIIALERGSGDISRFETRIYPEDHPESAANYPYVERLVKFLLWQRGGYRLYIGGPLSIGKFIQTCYSPTGVRKFDHDFMGQRVYEKPFEILTCKADEVPLERETVRSVGRHLDGCRIGFDLGASDRKVSAVVDGEVVYSEEVIWEPKKQTDPEYHYRELITALKTAAGKMPRVDAIGGSSAGVFIEDRPMVGSLFRSIPEDRFGEIKNLFNRIRDEMGVPLVVINDGDVTALAGSMSLEDNGILGIALGSSQAAGYVNLDGHIMGWLNELAFAPIDFNPQAVIEEWSGDKGCGASYFSQQCIFRLAPAARILIPPGLVDAEKLKYVQDLLESGHVGAERIWRTQGVYLGYGIAHYADYYEMKHVLILGRCTSGAGGELILSEAQRVLDTEFPNLAQRIHIQLPDEKSRRVGQSIAAASLPVRDL
jgi:predicted NBD/HSP70 family sugar kinase